MSLIDEDADGATIARGTISAARECARMIGKIGPRFTALELAEMEEAVGRITNAIELKKRMNAAP
ncbi:hypothetical protein EN978_07460 [Mesorhizobium sp. M7A.F.Ca.US.001.04.1.1]|uniref:hypothetical protein n=1 Tax=Mesorhizobium sp. M7A.F.Ca.US.001.04.2.1 TaxID=2496727 RepID=UPI000FC9E78E|nr:hypothetical protein [Mesorhizobium sp. M7A.F.Ca.US.001.04.2.1]RUY44029.1 hypothetical protein EN978_07460 [Mesorhizobium sp. M7A.F.Ca.US.001.04.1.1]